ncbi:MAG: hypothetical protein D6775_04295, partial [Caldilineae bacterium]
ADAGAIRDFVAYALTRWQAPPPAFLVLFGDGHYDPLGHLGGPPVQVPVYLSNSDPWLGEVADENAFAAVAGSDIVPDIMSGRLPVNTLTQAQSLVDKLIAYDAMSRQQSWQRDLVLVADDPDTAGDFYALADDVARQVDGRLRVRRFDLRRDPPDIDTLRSRLTAAWSEGALVVNYIGHGQPDAWAGERILVREDVASLRNYARPAVLLAMASLTGVFYWPTSPSLQEEMLLLPEGRGIVGYVASTGYGLATGNALVNRGFLRALLSGHNPYLGAAALLGRLELFGQGYDYSEFLVRQYALFGDPATQMPTPPWSKQDYLPSVQASLP